MPKSSSKTFETSRFLIKKEHRLFSNSTRKPHYCSIRKGYFSIFFDDEGHDSIQYLPTPALAYARSYGWGVDHEGL